MSPNASREVLVHRIAVDEKLADDLIRLVVCPLAEGVEEFFDRDQDWEREREWRVRPQNYARKMGIPSAKRKEWPWERLTEGQVFLSGEFEIVGDESAPDYFKVSPGRKEFLRIDGLEVFKDAIRRTYSKMLTSRL